MPLVQRRGCGGAVSRVVVVMMTAIPWLSFSTAIARPWSRQGRYVGLVATAVSTTCAFSYASERWRGQKWAPSTTLLQSISDSTSSSVNGDDDKNPNANNGDKQASQKGRTGWTHSVPDASSNFWVRGGSKQDVNDDKDKAESGSSKFRTGWLHNQRENEETAQPPPSSSSASSLNIARQRLNQARLQATRNHRIVAPVTFHTTSAQKVVAVTEHVISVPLVHKDLPKDDPNDNNNSRLDVYFTIVERVDTSPGKTDTYRWMQHDLGLDRTPTQRAQAYVQQSALQNADSLCLYLQGGPGFGSPAPVASLSFASADASWAAQALFSGAYDRIVLLDQRGTGQSTPVTKQTLQQRFPNLFLLDDAVDAAQSWDSVAATHSDEANKVLAAVQDVTQYLSHFRADSIVRDAELVREAILAPPSLDDDAVDNNDDIPKPWGGCLGQSYGGFCLLTYMSQIAHPPQICLFTGGIAPVTTPLPQVYTSLWQRVRTRSLRYYEQYPGDVQRVKQMVQRLLKEPVPLPSGGRLTAHRFLQLGLNYLGSSPSSFASFHALLNSALIHDTDVQFSRAFLKAVDSLQSFDDHPLYYWMHESIYANGGAQVAKNCPTAWAAHNAYQALVDTDPGVWDYRVTSQDGATNPTLWFGEMVFPWMSGIEDGKEGDYAELCGFGLRGVAQALADKTDWGPLWDTAALERALADGSCRAAAAVYYDDLYVDFDASMHVLKGPMAACKVYVTNEYQHSGLRDNGASVFSKLYGMATGATRIPS